MLNLFPTPQCCSVGCAKETIVVEGIAAVAEALPKVTRSEYEIERDYEHYVRNVYVPHQKEKENQAAAAAAAVEKAMTTDTTDESIIVVVKQEAAAPVVNHTTNNTTVNFFGRIFCNDKFWCQPSSYKACNDETERLFTLFNDDAGQTFSDKKDEVWSNPKFVEYLNTTAKAVALDEDGCFAAKQMADRCDALDIPDEKGEAASRALNRLTEDKKVHIHSFCKALCN